MKWLNQLSLLFLVLFVTVSVQAATLNISVKDAQTGQNLSRASVTITPEVGDAATGMSDTTGTLEIANLAAGNSRLPQLQQVTRMR